MCWWLLACLLKWRAAEAWQTQRARAGRPGRTPSPPARPGRRPPFWAVERPASPHKSAIEARSTVKNARTLRPLNRWPWARTVAASKTWQNGGARTASKLRKRATQVPRLRRGLTVGGVGPLRARPAHRHLRMDGGEVIITHPQAYYL